jgi:tetratricopeptide (TPR) repeat protein
MRKRYINFFSLPSVHLIFIALAGFLIYWNSLSGEFLWDDNFLIRDNSYIKNSVSLPQLFTGDIGEGAGYCYGSYRPIQMWGLNVTGYHLTNILLHVFSALSIYWFITLLYNNKRLSFLSSLLFVAHPIHTGAVSYISGRSSPLELIFMLLAFIFYIKQNQAPGIARYVLMAVSYSAALLSRESSLILPGLILLYHYVFRKKIKVLEFLPIALCAVLYVWFRKTMFVFSVSPITYSTTILERIPGFFAAFTDYLGLLFLPIGLHIEYGAKIFKFSGPKVLIGMIVFITLVLYAFSQRQKRGYRAFAIFWFLIALMPVSNIYPPLNAYMAEHWLYVPCVGFCLFISKNLLVFFDRKTWLKYAVFALTIGIVSSYAVLTIRQNNFWKDPVKFHERALQYAPGDSRIFTNANDKFSGVSEDIGNIEEAILSDQKAIALNPNNAEAYNNLGAKLNEAGRFQEAIEQFNKALNINPYLNTAYNNLGNAYASIGRYSKAIEMFKKALELNPDSADVYNNFGKAYYGMGQKEKAIVFLKRAIEIKPDFAYSYANLAVIYYNAKEEELAKEYRDKAVSLDSNFSRLLEPYQSKNMEVK